jgi:hypothetical protein
MHASHQFINDYFEHKELIGSFEIDTNESLFESCKVTAEYVALQVKYYGARLAKASYDAKLAYDESGNPLFVTENNELVDGIWIGIPNEVYHSLPTLSSSMVKKYRTCPKLYKRTYIDDIQRNRLKAAEHTLNAGTYAHEIVLEPEGFMDRHYRGLVKAEHPNALVTLDDLKSHAKELGITSGLSKKETVIKQILEIEPLTPIFDVMDAKNDELNKGKNKIDGIVYDDAIRCAKTILSHGDAGPLLNPDEGLPEVSIIYTCPITGLKKRSRFDFLRFDNRAVDVKTTKSCEVTSFSKDAVNMGYGIQEMFYRESYFVVTGLDLDDFIFVASEYATMDDCETFYIDDEDFDKLFGIYEETMTNLHISLKDNVWHGHSVTDKRKKIRKPKFCEW